MSSRLLKLASFLVMLSLFDCSGGAVTGSADQRKKGATKDPTESDGSSTGSGEASEPQVVTGGYLTCQLDSAGAQAGELGLGCGIYDSDTNSKKDIGSKTLQLTATNSKAANIVSRTTVEPKESKFHNKIFVSNTAKDDLKIEGSLSGSGSEVETYEFVYSPNTAGSTILKEVKLYFKVLIKIGDPKGTNVDHLKTDYTEAELSNWCKKTLPNRSRTFSWISDKDCVEFGAGCGYDYIKSRGCKISIDVIDWYVKTYNSEGLCEKRNEGNYCTNKSSSR